MIAAIGLPPLRLRCSSYFLDRCLGKEPRPAGRQGFMDESIDAAVADQASQRGFGISTARHQHDEVGKLTLDLLDEQLSGLLQHLRIKNQDADAAGDEKVAHFVGGRDMPKPARRADCLAKRLKEGLVAGKHHQLDDVTRKTEPQRIERAASSSGASTGRFLAFCTCRLGS